MFKKILVTVTIVVLAAVGAMALFKTYSVKQHVHGAQLLSSADQAYVFIGTSRMGWRRSYLEFAKELVLAYLQAPTPPQDVRSSVTVLRMTEARFPLGLGGQQRVLVVTEDAYGRWAAIDVQKPNQAPERVWYLDEQGRPVSRDEYYQFLSE